MLPAVAAQLLALQSTNLSAALFTLMLFKSVAGTI
jgi:hypothetical protein